MGLARATRRTAQAAVAALALMVTSAVPATAAPGQVDASFGASGTVLTQFPDSYSGGRAVALRPGGEIVAAGFAHTNDSVASDFAIAQYKATGELDPAFGTGGRVRTDIGGRYDDALAVAVQPNGKVVVAGSSSDSTGSDMAVARYNRNGTLDTEFDGDGIALVDLGNESFARSVAVQRNGKILLAGSALRPEGDACCVADFTLVRLTRSGALDGTFGDGGRVFTDFLPGPDNGFGAASAVMVQPDGRIVAAGTGDSGGDSVDFVISRYRANGSLDPTFSRDGRNTTDFAGYQDEIRALAIDTYGRIVAAGQACEFPRDSDEVCDFGLVRFTGHGILDERFGHSGKVLTDLGADVNEGVRGVVIQRDGRIVAAGETQGDVGLTRYRADGRLDRSFGGDGIVVTPVSPSTDEVGGLKFQADGRLVVAGTAAVSQSFGFFVSRYLGS